MPISVSMVNKTRRQTPRLPFLAMKNVVLGKKYNLSLAFVGNATSKKLNKTYRDKNKPSNILSFPLSKTEGEIIMDLAKIKGEVRFFKRPFANLVAFLFIHGLFHLKGLEHGSTMESKEVAVRRRFGV